MISPFSRCPPADYRGTAHPSGVETIRRISAEVRAETAQTMAEYAVVLAVITIAVVVTLGLLSTAIKGKLTSVIGIL